MQVQSSNNIFETSNIDGEGVSKSASSGKNVVTGDVSQEFANLMSSLVGKESGEKLVDPLNKIKTGIQDNSGKASEGTKSSLQDILSNNDVAKSGLQTSTQSPESSLLNPSETSVETAGLQISGNKTESQIQDIVNSVKEDVATSEKKVDPGQVKRNSFFPGSKSAQSMKSAGLLVGKSDQQVPLSLAEDNNLVIPNSKERSNPLNQLANKNFGQESALEQSHKIGKNQNVASDDNVLDLLRPRQAKVKTGHSFFKNYSEQQSTIDKGGKVIQMKNQFATEFDSDKGQKGVKLNTFKAGGELQEAELKVFDRNIAEMGNLKVQGTAENQITGQAKVFNISNLKSADTADVINRITNYVEQNALANEQSLDLTVKHDELGRFKVNVTRDMVTKQLDIEILTGTQKGTQFFVENEAKLAQTLSNSGLKVADVRVVSSGEFTRMGNESKDSSSNNEDSLFNKNNNKFAGQGGGRDSEDADSKRRRDLWETYKERYGA